MSIKLTVLKSGEQVISDMKELIAEDEEQAHAYMLVNHHTYEINEKQFQTEQEKEDRAQFAYEACWLSRERLVSMEVFEHFGMDAEEARQFQLS